MFRALIYLSIVGGICYWFWYDPQVTRPPGILVAQDPVQDAIRKESWTKGNYQVTPMARISLRARVLSKSHYLFDREAELSPYDLALGWQKMSDSANLDRMSITQGGRWYDYDWKKPATLLTEEVTFMSSNMHIIPANKEVLDALDRIIRGDIIGLEGYLVRIDAPDGWKWISSGSRVDTGTGSCELVWVEKLTIDPRPGAKTTSP